MELWYKKGNLWGRDGYYISTEYTDPRFYFGTLADIKKEFATRFKAVKLTWIKSKY